jgi:biotin transport system substrate-specific component
MSRSTAQNINHFHADSFVLTRQLLIVIGASLFVALCARLSLPLPFTPVPLTMANFGVLVVGLTLGSRRGFAALCLYLLEGAAGLPVFSGGALGAIHFFGPTGGYLMSYPLVAFLAGFIAERGARTHTEAPDEREACRGPQHASVKGWSFVGAGFLRTAIASTVAEIALFVLGVSWLAAMAHVSVGQAAHFGLYPFVFAEVIKVMSAAGIAQRLQRFF